MAQDHKFIQLFNQEIPTKFREQYIQKSSTQEYVLDFYNYQLIYKILYKHVVTPNKTHLKIYDYTTGLKQPGKLFMVNDHINRIGDNPFIGKQSFFNIDFINVEKLYIPHTEGVITNSCGGTLCEDLQYPSSYLANIAIIGSLLNYKIKGYLIHV